MKTPDLLLDMPAKDFDDINQYFWQEQTQRDLRNALYETRKDYGGISLEVVAETIGSVFDSAEVGMLIELLSTHEDKN